MTASAAASTVPTDLTWAGSVVTQKNPVPSLTCCRYVTR